MGDVIEFNKALKFKEDLKETAEEEYLFDTLDSLLDHVEDVADHGILLLSKIIGYYPDLPKCIARR